MSITEENIAGVGHNRGPSPGAALITTILKNIEMVERGAHEYLEAEHADLMRRLKEILETAQTLPPRIQDGDKVTAEQVSDVRYAIKKWIAAAKQARTAEKRPFDGLAKIMYAWFSKPIEDLEEIDKKSVAPIIDDYQSREVARARREAEAEAARQRDLAAAAERERAEAEARRLEAERKEREAKEAAERAEKERQEQVRLAAEAKARREREEREAAEAATRAIAEQKKADEARARREEEERLAAERRETEAAAQAEADQRLEAARRQEAEAKTAVEAADAQRRTSAEAAAKSQAEERAAKESAAAAKLEQAEAERAAVTARKEQRTARKDEREADDDSARADRKADKADDKATGSAADLSRIRGEAGSVSSQRTFWAFRNLERSKLDVEKLRNHVPLSAYEMAIRSYLDANTDGGKQEPPPISGVEFFRDTGTVTR